MAEIVEKINLSDAQKKRQRNRSIAIAIVLGLLVVMFYAVTIVKMGPGIVNRPALGPKADRHIKPNRETRERHDQGTRR